MTPRKRAEQVWSDLPGDQDEDIAIIEAAIMADRADRVVSDIPNLGRVAELEQIRVDMLERARKAERERDEAIAAREELSRRYAALEVNHEEALTFRQAAIALGRERDQIVYDRDFFEAERDACRLVLNGVRADLAQRDQTIYELNCAVQEIKRERDDARKEIVRHLDARGFTERERDAALDMVTQRDRRIVELEAALRFCDPRNATARYDRIADDFFHETGLWSPGRDASAAMGIPESQRDEADKRWRTFVNAWHERWFDAALSAPVIQASSQSAPNLDARPATAAKEGEE